MTYFFANYWVFVALFAVLGSSVLNYTQRLNARLAALQARVDFLYEKTGIVFDAFPPLSAEIQDALAKGEKIKAIKLYREASGIGLKEAKDLIESAMRGDRPAKKG